MIVKVCRSSESGKSQFRSITFYQAEKVTVQTGDESGSLFETSFNVFVTSNGNPQKIFLMPDHHVELLNDLGKVIDVLSPPVSK